MSIDPLNQSNFDLSIYFYNERKEIFRVFKNCFAEEII